MTLSTFAGGAAGSPIAAVTYEPGVCNIGPDEIRRRRRSGHVGAVATFVLLAILEAIGAPPLARLVLVIPAAGSAAGYLQAWLKFCAGFGSRGVFNFGAVGETQDLVDDDARRRDRSRAVRVGLASVAIGAAVAIVAVLLPL
jgi:hypothetical protein